MIRKNPIYHALGVLRDASDEEIDGMPQQIRGQLKALKTAWLGIPERTRFDQSYRDTYEEFPPEIQARIADPDEALRQYDERKAREQQGTGRT